MSALFDFNAFLIVVLLTICTCTYVKTRAPRLLSVKTGYWLNHASCGITMLPAQVTWQAAYMQSFNVIDTLLSSHSFRGLFWKAARIGVCWRHIRVPASCGVHAAHMYTPPDPLTGAMTVLDQCVFRLGLQGSGLAHGWPSSVS